MIEQQKAGQRPELRRFVTFLATGTAAACCNIGARVLLSHVTSYGVAVAVAYLIGMVVAFVLAKLFVFDSNPQRWHAELARFAMVNGVAFVQVWLVSLGLERYVLPGLGWQWHEELCAHVAGVGSPILTSYIAHKHFTFRPDSIVDLDV